MARHRETDAGAHRRRACEDEPVTTIEPTPPWRTDTLGGPWQARTIDLRPDAQGGPVATLVHLADGGAPASDTRKQTAVLFLHGFSDYFFQAHHARSWADRGYAVYALDMRDHGRSIRAGRRPGWVPDVSVHTEELAAAIGLIRTAGASSLVVVGHSTGGLIASLYADRHPGQIDALVLNSPWFDLNRAPHLRPVLRPGITALARLAPDLVISTLGPAYGSSLHTSTGGEFDFVLDYKPLDGFPVRAGWLASVLRAQRRLRHGLDITAPVLVCRSDASGHPTSPTTTELTWTDAVLDVRDMQRWAARLGAHVQVEVVIGGRHDLALSVEPARTRYTSAVLDWVDAQVRPYDR